MGLHQDSVLCQLLFVVVMYAVCSGVKGMLNELLYADNLVFMEDSMEKWQVKFDKRKNVIQKNDSRDVVCWKKFNEWSIVWREIVIEVEKAGI